MGKIKVTQTRSYIKRPENQKRTLKALGLKKIGHSVEHYDSDVVLGMIDKVKHLVSVEQI
jgi:large subunit ribosomal protein L30